MKFFFFHLMPYADLDLDYVEKYNSAWVTLPNSYFDSRKGHALYNRYLDELELADRLGFDGVCVNEHHQNAYGLMPIPGVMAGALARRTAQAKIAVLGRALPLVNNPLTIAEEFAMLDVITGGRFIAGFVRGIGAEYHSWGVNPATSHERFHEAHDLIIRAWTETGPFRYEGKHYHFEYVNCWPRPYQQPHPPVWTPSQGSRETIEWAAHPSRRYTYLQTFSPAAALAQFMKLYSESAERQGWIATPDHKGWSVPIYVGESDAAAYREAKPHIENFINRFLRMTVEMRAPPGYQSLASAKAVRVLKRSLNEGQDIDGLIEKGMFLCGGPATVRDLIERHQDAIGFGNLLANLQFGTLPHELVRQSATRFAREVIPYFRSKAGIAAPAVEAART